MPIREDEIEEADSEKLYPLAITFGSNGTARTVNIEYRAPTTERVTQPTAAARVAALIAKWDVLGKDDQPLEPSLAYWMSKPITYVTRFQEEIEADFFRAKGK